MGRLLDWDNMPPVGTKVRFVGYMNDRHKHWPYIAGKVYTICEDSSGDTAPMDEQGHCPPQNWGNSFVFEIIDEPIEPFTINEGDYIDSSEFTREECERFCEIAVGCGFDFGKRNRFEINWFKSNFESGYECEYLTHLGVGLLTIKPQLWWEIKEYWAGTSGNNITTQFREFLDKEKGMGKFTKDDLKDGMRCIDRDGDIWYVCGGFLSHKGGHTTNDVFEGVSKWGEDFKCVPSRCDIMKVIDLDDTVMWEREEEPRELTIEEIAKAFNLPPERVRIKK